LELQGAAAAEMGRMLVATAAAAAAEWFYALPVSLWMLARFLLRTEGMELLLEQPTRVVVVLAQAERSQLAADTYRLSERSRLPQELLEVVQERVAMEARQRPGSFRR
jgi:hypothetical protein